MIESPHIAVLIPCYNEEQTIAEVVRAFGAALPGAAIYVYDNNSTDATGLRAAEAHAEVRLERIQGKGCVVRRMFADIDADCYVLVDGDGTYDPSAAPHMVDLLRSQHLAMVVARRVQQGPSAYRTWHVAGNRIFTSSVSYLFGSTFTDVLSGYRVLSHAFVKSFPVFSSGFEIETELSVHALTLGMPVAEIPSVYTGRPQGSESKLHTFRDGARILRAVLMLFKNEKPLLFFFLLGCMFMGCALLMAVPIVVTYVETGLVPRFPTAILATGLALSALITFACGLILDTVTKGRRETKLLAYLNATRWPATGSRVWSELENHTAGVKDTASAGLSGH